MQNTITVPLWLITNIRRKRLTLFGVSLLLAMTFSPNTLASDAREPAEVYRQVCSHCHASDKAVGPAITRAFPEAAQESWKTYIQLTVRNGRAAMPAFRHSEITEDELKGLSAALARGELAEDSDEE